MTWRDIIDSITHANQANRASKQYSQALLSEIERRQLTEKIVPIFNEYSNYMSPSSALIEACRDLGLTL